MRKSPRSSPQNHERWLVSYADFITLLFAFFVVMFATSQTDRSRAKQVSESVKKALEQSELRSVVASILGGTVDDKGQGNAQFKGPGGEKLLKRDKQDAEIVELLPSLEILRRELREEIRAGKINISMQARGLTLSFQQAALFPSGGDELVPEAAPSIAKIAEAIRRIPNPVRLEGHTDAIPIHNARFQSNWDLSAARSIALLKRLSELRVPPGRLSIAGYAETAPVASNRTEEGRARNRRVDLIILNETGVQGEPAREPQQD